MKRIARHVRGHCIAYLALFLVLGGTSVAAVQALPKNSITSKQIKNGTILKADLAKSTIAALHGARGARGPAGAAGPAGPTGATGATGAAGATGATGPAGPFPDGNLPSGKTIRGDYGVLGANGSNGYAGISFGFTLSAGPTIDYIPAGTAVPAACAGGTIAMPQANPGHLCIFEAFHSGNAAGAFDPATNSTTTAGRTGAVVYNTSSGGAASNAEGTWAVTAP